MPEMPRDATERKRPQSPPGGRAAVSTRDARGGTTSTASTADILRRTTRFIEKWNFDSSGAKRVVGKVPPHRRSFIFDTFGESTKEPTSFLGLQRYIERCDRDRLWPDLATGRSRTADSNAARERPAGGREASPKRRRLEGRDDRDDRRDDRHDRPPLNRRYEDAPLKRPSPPERPLRPSPPDRPPPRPSQPDRPPARSDRKDASSDRAKPSSGPSGPRQPDGPPPRLAQAPKGPPPKGPPPSFARDRAPPKAPPKAVVSAEVKDAVSDHAAPGDLIRNLLGCL